MAIDLNDLRARVGDGGRGARSPEPPPGPPKKGGAALLVAGIVAVAAISFCSKNEKPKREEAVSSPPVATELRSAPPRAVPTPAPRPAVVPTAESAPLPSTEAPNSRATGHYAQLIAAAIDANRADIMAVLNLAFNGQPHDIESAALAAGRSFDFSTQAVERNRKEARALNQQALAAFVQSSYVEAYHLGTEAFRFDPLDVEIAGNLGIFAVRTGRTMQAQHMALYALSLPRAPEKTGRTSDWNTLSASFAAHAKAELARNALYVTLAIAPNVQKRCMSAVHSVRHTYGDLLKDATQAMFERVRQQELSDARECQLPIQW